MVRMNLGAMLTLFLKVYVTEFLVNCHLEFDIFVLNCCSLLSKLQKATAWRKSGESFVQSMGTLIERLLDYR